MKDDKKKWFRRSHRLKIFLMTVLRWLKQKVKTDPRRKEQLVKKQRPLREGGEDKSQSREFKRRTIGTIRTGRASTSKEPSRSCARVPMTR